MIVFQAQGGLGNQLFQYATARRIALQHQCPLVVDHHWFNNPRPGETPRRLELTRYPLQMRLANRNELARWAPLRSRWAQYVKPLLPLKLIREKGYGINRLVLNASAKTYLSGYWQSELYFNDIRDLLLTELSPIEPPSTEDAIVIAQIRQCESVSIHIRRGDYVTSSSASVYHGLCSIDYYHSAIDYIAKRVDNPTLFVFSDDPQWAEANLCSQHPTVYVKHNSPDNAFQDLRMMSLCKHHILANSSFSWWGAWLAQHPCGIVVAPSRWFAANHPTPNLIPSRWVIIPT